MLDSLRSLFGGGPRLAKTPPNWLGITPVDTTIYVIGDVHGYDDALADIHAQIDRDIDREHAARKSAKLPPQKIIEVYLSDFTDRGPNTKGVIDIQIARHSRNRNAGIKSHYLAADHEHLFISMLKETKRLDNRSKDFFDNGGLETLRSYDVQPHVSKTKQDETAHKIRGTDIYVNDAGLIAMKAELWSKIPKSHAGFLKKAKPMLHLGQYTFVHAAVDPTLPITIEDQDPRILTGISDEARKFPHYTGKIPGDRIIVRAHSISDEPILTQNQIGLDTGIFKPGGKLTCAILREDTVSFMQAKTNQPPYSLTAAVKKAIAAAPASQFEARPV